jgi:chromosome segregation ATPase
VEVWLPTARLSSPTVDQRDCLTERVPPAEYEQSGAIEYPDDSDGEELTSPGSAYTVGGGRYEGLVPAGARQQYASGSAQGETRLQTSASLTETRTSTGSAARTSSRGGDTAALEALTSLANRGLSPFTQASATSPLGASSGSTSRIPVTGSMSRQPTFVAAPQRWPPAAEAGTGADASRLTARLAAQAREVSELTAALNRAESYAHRVERRLLEIVPDHAVPVGEGAFGTVPGKLSRLARAAAEELVGGASPGKIAGASHIVSAGAADRRVARDSGSVIKALERQLEKSRRQVDEAQARIKELRGAVEVKEKDRVHALRRADGLSQKVVGLEAEMRLVGLVVPPPGGDGGAGGASGTASAGGAGSEAAEARIRALEAELDVARSSTSDSAALRDARAQISVLERALAAASSPAGLQPEDAAGLLLTRMKEARMREEECRTLTAALRAAEARIVLLEGTAPGRASSPQAYGTPSRRRAGAGSVDAVVVTSPTLGDITASSHRGRGAAATRAAAVRAQGGEGAGETGFVLEHSVARLEAEKGALLDYISDLRDSHSKMSGVVEALTRERALYEGQARRAKEAAQEAHASGDTAAATVGTATRQLADVQRQLRTATDRLRELTAQHATATAALAARAGELSEAAAVQEELLDTIRADKRALEEAKVEADGLRRRAVDAGRRVDSAEAAMEQVEAERDGLEARVHALVREARDATGRTREADKHASEAASVAERAAVEAIASEDSVVALQRTVRALVLERDELMARVKELNTSAGAVAVEVATLRAAGLGVEAAEVQVGRFLRAAAATTAAATAVTAAAEAPAADAPASPGDETASAGLVDPEEEGQPRARRGPAVKATGGRPQATGGVDEDASAHSAIQAAATAGRIALERAEHAKVWANEAAVNSAVPQTASAARQLAGWLRTASSALADTSRRMGQELEDRRMQRRMLFDEVHSLRDLLADSRDGMLRERSRAAEAEGHLGELTVSAQGEVSTLRAALADASAERDKLRAAYANATAGRSASAEELDRARARLESLEASVTGMTIARDAAVGRLEEVSRSLHTCSVERDGLADTLRDTHRSLAESRSHNSVIERERVEGRARVLALEKAAAGADVGARASAAALAAAEARVAELSTALEASKRDSAGLAERHSGVLEELESFTDLSHRQNGLCESLQAQLRAAGEERAALQRALGGLSVELDGTRAELEGLSAENEGRVSAVLGSLQRLGVDTGAALAAGRDVHAATTAAASSASPSASSASFSPTSTLVSRLRASVAVLSGAAGAAAARVSTLLTESGSLRAELAAMRPRLDAVAEVVHTAADRGRALAAAEGTISDLRTSLSAAENAVSSLQAEASALRGRLSESSLEIERTHTRVAMLVTDGEGARESERRSATVLTEATARIAGLEEELSRMVRDADGLVAQRCVCCRPSRRLYLSLFPPFPLPQSPCRGYDRA